VYYDTNKLYIVANILKYGSISLIIFYCCIYFGLLDITEVGIKNSIRLIRNVGFGSCVDEWL